MESLDFIKGFLQELEVFICKLSAYGYENLVEVIAGASSVNVIAVAGVLKGFSQCYYKSNSEIEAILR